MTIMQQTLVILAGFLWPLWLTVGILAVLVMRKYPVLASVVLTACAILPLYVFLHY